MIFANNARWIFPFGICWPFRHRRTPKNFEVPGFAMQGMPWLSQDVDMIHHCMEVSKTGGTRKSYNFHLFSMEPRGDLGIPNCKILVVTPQNNNMNPGYTSIHLVNLVDEPATATFRTYFCQAAVSITVSAFFFRLRKAVRPFGRSFAESNTGRLNCTCFQVWGGNYMIDREMER